MPKVLEKSGSDYSLLVWNSTEPIDELLKNASLTSEEKSKYDSFISQTRKREWLTVRKMVKDLIPESSPIVYDENGKPHLKNYNLSISHSHNWIAILVSPHKRVGIDIEIIGSRIDKLAVKFLCAEEDLEARSDKRIEKLHVMWGAKETLFKIHGIGNVEFKSEFLVYPFNYSHSGIVKASNLKKGFEKEYDVYYLKSEGYMIVWCVD